MNGSVKRSTRTRGKLTAAKRQRLSFIGRFYVTFKGERNETKNSKRNRGFRAYSDRFYSRLHVVEYLTVAKRTSDFRRGEHGCYWERVHFTSGGRYLSGLRRVPAKRWAAQRNA